MSETQVAIVTGGTFGIGREISMTLAAAGYRVVAFGLDRAPISSTADKSITSFWDDLEDTSLTVDVLEADVSDKASVQSVIDYTMGNYGRIDALINNAAIGPLGTILDTDPETFEAILNVNVKGTYLASAAVVPHMQEQGGGAIVNIGSGAGWGKPNMAAYSASKGGIFALSQAMAYDFFHDCIRVNTVVPGGGGIRSGMTLGRVAGDESRLDPAPLGSSAGRPVRGEDIGHAVAFLISDKAEAISGTVIDVGCFANQGGPLKRKDIS